MTNNSAATPWWQTIVVSVVLATCAFFASASRINHGLIESERLPGPGLTLDESFNIAQGIYLVESIRESGWLAFDPVTVSRIFDEENGHLPDHPPLGRILLGISHAIFADTIDGNGTAVVNVAAARMSVSFVFALMVALLVGWACRRDHLVVGCLVGLLLLGVPRLLGHSRIASLETATNLFWVAACLPLLSWWTDSEPPSRFRSQITGAFWGLLLLTKVQGILLPPVVFLWAAWRFRRNCLKPLTWWLVSGGAIFFAFWPWLWHSPIDHCLQYLGRTTDRIPLNAWHWGQRFADKQVPWHYPLILTLVTLPLVVPGGLLQCFKYRRQLDSCDALIAAIAIGPLLVFSIPGVPVYDGARLFLVSFPMLVLLAARGFFRLITAFQLRRRQVLCGVIVFSLATGFAVTNVTGQYRLMQYNTIGKLFSTAQQREADYWAASLNGEFWKQVPEGSTVYVAPVLHGNQLPALQQMVPEIIHRNITLLPFEYDVRQKGLLLLIHRLADLRPVLRSLPEGATKVAEVRENDIVYARLIDTSNAAWLEVADWP